MATTTVKKHGRRWPYTSAGIKKMEEYREAEHCRFVELRKEQDDRKARHKLRRRAIKKKELLHKFRLRRLRNFNTEIRVIGATRSAPMPPPSLEKLRQHRTVEVKDRSFYKRSGFLWSDLSRTPKERLSLVVPLIAIKCDRECMNQLLSKVEQEEMEAQWSVRRKHERIAVQREQWFAKAAIGKVRQAKYATILTTKKGPDGISAADAPHPLPYGGKIKKPAVLSQRQKELARPKQPAKILTSYIISGNTDMVGLLHADPALKDVLEWHLEDLRKEIMAARFSKHAYSISKEMKRSTPVNDGIKEGRGWKKQELQQTPQTAQERSAVEWPYVCAAVQGVASFEFDSTVNLAEEESLSTCSFGVAAE